MTDPVTSDYSKPLPDASEPVSAPFWEATRAHHLVAQKCTSCGYVRWPPGKVCPECQTVSNNWVELSHLGHIYSYATYHRALAASFKSDLPYTVAYIQLDDGPRMAGSLIGDPNAFAVGLLVRAEFESVTPEVTLVRWRPIA